MTWLKLDDKMYTSPKVHALTSPAFRVHVGGLLHCCQHLTDGVVSRPALYALYCPDMGDLEALVDELVDARLWRRTDDGAYEIHDFLDFNPSRSDVEEKRDAEAKRKQAWREDRRREKARRGSPNGTDIGTPASRDAGRTRRATRDISGAAEAEIVATATNTPNVPLGRTRRATQDGHRDGRATRPDPTPTTNNPQYEKEGAVENVGIDEAKQPRPDRHSEIGATAIAGHRHLAHAPPADIESLGRAITAAAAIRRVQPTTLATALNDTLRRATVPADGVRHVARYAIEILASTRTAGPVMADPATIQTAGEALADFTPYRRPTMRPAAAS